MLTFSGVSLATPFPIRGGPKHEILTIGLRDARPLSSTSCQSLFNSVRSTLGMKYD